MSWSQNHHEPSRFVWWWSGEASLGRKLTGLPEREVAMERWWTWKLQNSGSNSVKSCILRDNFWLMCTTVEFSHLSQVTLAQSFGIRLRAGPTAQWTPRPIFAAVLSNFQTKNVLVSQRFPCHFHLKDQLKEASSYIVYLSLRGLEAFPLKLSHLLFI